MRRPRYGEACCCFDSESAESLVRRCGEIDDPSEMAKTIVRASEESRRVLEGRG